jgi:hypothetical protein
VALRARVLKDLVVVAALESLVTKEVDGSVLFTAREVLLVLEVLQTVALVPASWEDVEGDLAADRVSTVTGALALTKLRKQFG